MKLPYSLLAIVLVSLLGPGCDIEVGHSSYPPCPDNKVNGQVENGPTCSKYSYKIANVSTGEIVVDYFAASIGACLPDGTYEFKSLVCYYCGTNVGGSTDCTGQYGMLYSNPGQFTLSNHQTLNLTFRNLAVSKATTTF